MEVWMKQAEIDELRRLVKELLPLAIQGVCYGDPLEVGPNATAVLQWACDELGLDYDTIID